MQGLLTTVTLNNVERLDIEPHGRRSEQAHFLIMNSGMMFSEPQHFGFLKMLTWQGGFGDDDSSSGRI